MNVIYFDIPANPANIRAGAFAFDILDKLALTAFGKTQDLCKRSMESQLTARDERIADSVSGNYDPTVKSGKGQVFVGTTWVGNPATKEKRRVSSSEAESLLANGWIKAGPRTQL